MNMQFDAVGLVLCEFGLYFCHRITFILVVLSWSVFGIWETVFFIDKGGKHG